jgi:hypothetical protein
MMGLFLGRFSANGIDFSCFFRFLVVCLFLFIGFPISTLLCFLEARLGDMIGRLMIKRGLY